MILKRLLHRFSMGQGYLILLMIVSSLVLGACSGENQENRADKISGEALFKQMHIGKSLGCITCHSFSADIETVGPSLLGIGVRGGLVKENMSAEDYIYESIINPDAYIVAGYEPSIMYTGYANELSKEDLASLVDFLLKQ